MNILFLCTGNYYRSRFAEEYFNALARAKGLSHGAASRGLRIDEEGRWNIGPISSAALSELKKAGIVPAPPLRRPQNLLPGEPGAYDLIVCLDKKEHLPMVRTRSELTGKRILYWDIKDLGEESPESAMARCRKKVEELLVKLA